VTFFAPVQTGPRAHPASYTMGTGSLKQLEHCFNHTSKSYAGVKGRVELPQLFLCAFMAGYSLKLYLLLSRLVRLLW